MKTSWDVGMLRCMIVVCCVSYVSCVSCFQYHYTTVVTILNCRDTVALGWVKNDKVGWWWQIYSGAWLFIELLTDSKGWVGGSKPIDVLFVWFEILCLRSILRPGACSSLWLQKCVLLSKRGRRRGGVVVTFLRFILTYYKIKSCQLCSETCHSCLRVSGGHLMFTMVK